MGSTRFVLAEQAQRILSGGNVGSATKYHIRELIKAVGQVANQILKTEYMQTNAPLGEFIPSGYPIVVYDNLPAYKYGNVSAIDLPTAPVRLMRDIGCLAIYPTGNPSAAFIPLQNGDANMLLAEPLVSQLGGNIGYERDGLRVRFDEDITIPNQVVNISARLVVLDFNAYDDHTPLPIPADHEWTIIQEVVKMYAQEPIPDKLVDPGVKEQRIPIKDQMQP